MDLDELDELGIGIIDGDIRSGRMHRRIIADLDDAGILLNPVAPASSDVAVEAPVAPRNKHSDAA